jgi:hypothetical protein
LGYWGTTMPYNRLEMALLDLGATASIEDFNCWYAEHPDLNVEEATDSFCEYARSEAQRRGGVPSRQAPAIKPIDWGNGLTAQQNQLYQAIVYELHRNFTPSFYSPRPEMPIVNFSDRIRELIRTYDQHRTTLLKHWEQDATERARVHLRTTVVAKPPAEGSD